jgi:hypothetical protein
MVFFARLKCRLQKLPNTPIHVPTSEKKQIGVSPFEVEVDKLAVEN